MFDYIFDIKIVRIKLPFKISLGYSFKSSAGDVSHHTDIDLHWNESGFSLGFKHAFLSCQLQLFLQEQLSIFHLNEFWWMSHSPVFSSPYHNLFLKRKEKKFHFKTLICYSTRWFLYLIICFHFAVKVIFSYIITFIIEFIDIIYSLNTLYIKLLHYLRLFGFIATELCSEVTY